MNRTTMAEKKTDISIWQWISKIRFLLFFFILFAAAVSLQRQNIKPESFSIDSQSIEKELHKLEAVLEELVLQTKQDFIDGKFTRQDTTGTWIIDKDFTKYADKGFTVLVYRNDTLRFWSDNSVPIPFRWSKSKFENKKILNLGNGWFELKNEEITNGHIIGLMRIKNSYSYENQYLENAFRPELDIPASVKISEKQSTYGKIIKNKNGEIIFSLVPVSKVVPIQKYAGWAGILYFLSFAFLLLYLNSVFQQLVKLKNGEWYVLIISALLIIGRYFMIKLKFPFFIYSLLYFEPEVYTGNAINPYLGDLIFNAGLLFFFSVNFFRLLHFEQIINKLGERSKAFSYILAVLLPFLSAVFFSYISKLIYDLIINSNIEFRIHSIPKLTLFTLSAYIIITLLLSSFAYITDRFLKIFALQIEFRKFLLLLIPVLLFSGGYFYLFNTDEISYLLPTFALVLFTIGVTRFIKTEYRYYTFSLLIFIFSVYIISSVYTDLEKKRRAESTVLVSQLEDERDVVAELLLNEISNRIKEDDELRKLLLDVVEDHKLKVHGYLKRRYFYGFWEKYKLTTTLCGNSIYYPPNNQAKNCEKYFLKNIQEFGHKLESSDFYFIGNRDGTITYFGKYSVPPTLDERKISVYIQLKEKLTDIKLGYPDLLIEEPVRDDLFEGYSYAKYRKGKLVSKSGDFPFDLSDRSFRQSDSAFIERSGYIHHIHRPNQNNLIVLSRSKTTLLDYITAFAYLFVILNILFLLSVLISNPKFLLKKFKPDFKNRIRFSMLFVLIITFVFFTGGTVFYATTQYKDSQNKRLAEKMQSVLTELKHKLNNEEKLSPEWQTETYEHLDEMLIKFSQVFFVDINLYSLNGSLLATSRPEIFERRLISKQMNRSAYRELVMNKKALIIRKEQIGNLSYSSVYIPFENKDNQVIAYVNLPYFTDDAGLQKNISNLLITTINIYVILFLLTILLAFIISANITRPLRMLQSKFKNVQLGKKHQEINYFKDDEVGALVSEYNRMVAELEKSVKQLAETERESAWREMAKQIAHEIKNPLTPMKLSVQLLQRSWKDSKEDFEKRLSNVSNTLIEQIDTLSAIASEFSAFAKMPKPQDEELNLGEKLDTVVRLFENTSNVEVKLDLHHNENVFILADKEQISRVFINIIKNGIQSIPEGIKGKVYVELTTYGNYAKVTIEDNGNGIPEDKRDKLFKPSFTTKTTGMGMGLAIVKNIINSAKGEIWFESELGKGTKFFVEFPIYSEE